MTITQDIWEGCYRGGWGDLLGQPSMAHPAKMARGLAARIYQHVLEEQWIQAGGRVIDPFGGIAGTAFHAMVHGLVWQGVELEPRFVAWGQGVDCDGSSCPQCAKEIKAGEHQAQMFERVPHRYAGNIETWERKGLPGTARLIQGDSRKLKEVLANAELTVTSPPYGQRTVHGQAGIDFSRSEKRDRTGHGGQVDTQDRYGEENGNLGNMAMSDHALAVSSPPYSPHALGHKGVGNEVDKRKGLHARCSDNQYGATAGQLSQMKEGDLPTGLAVSSPPYVAPPGHGGESGQWETLAKEKDLHRPTYGSNDGQLGQMKEGSIDLSLSSPPYGHDTVNSRNGIDEDSLRAKYRVGKTSQATNMTGYGEGAEQIANLPATEEGLECAITSPPFLEGRSSNRVQSSVVEDQSVGGATEHRRTAYGTAEGNLAVMDEGSIADACITSPPYIDSVNARDHGIDWEKCDPKTTGGRKRGDDCQHGQTLRNQLSYNKDPDPANLGAMVPGDLNTEISITSPPYAQQHSGGGDLNVEGYSKDWQKKDMKDMVGNRTYQGRGADRADGNLELMDSNGFEASITSPPYESQEITSRANFTGGGGNSQPANIPTQDRQNGYGATDGNISAAPETFWSASRLILEQLFDVIKPGGHAVFVTGDFVRDRRRVRFGEQWRQLCEAVGFVCLHHHIATKTEDRGTQGLLDGGEAEQQSSKISFFRRNHIDNERAVIHWPSIENQAEYLSRAETKLREEYDKRVAAKKTAVLVTEARILQVAQKTAWREDGAPTHDTDIAILNEDVYCFLRP